MAHGLHLLVGGVEQVEGESLHVKFRSEEGELDFSPPAMRVADRVTLPRTIFAEAFAFLNEHAGAGQTPKLTIPSPSMVHYRGGNSSIDESVYPDRERFWDDLVDAYRAQISGVYGLGCRYLQLEDKDLLKRRIEEAARYVDPDQLCLSPQCGFSSTEQGNKLTIDEERAKLELIVEIAAEVWD